MASNSILILLTSLPLFFFMLYYEKLLEKTLLELIQILTPPPLSNDNSKLNFPGQTMSLNDFIHLHEPGIYRLRYITPEFSKRFMSLCFLHLIPLHLLTLLSAISTVHLSSRLLIRDQESSFTISWLHLDKLKGIFITSIIVLSLSLCALLGFLWFSMQYPTMGMAHLFNQLSILVLLVKFLELSAVWNMSLVISILEEVVGMRAFSLAFYFNKGSERRGLFLMFVFFALGLGLRIPCLFEGGDREVGFVARTGFLWVVHLVKWVACTWYYFDCKNRVLERKVDLEAGGKVEGESSKC